MTISKKITILLVVLAFLGAGVWAVRKFTDKKTANNPAGVSVDPKQQEFDAAIKKASALDQDLDGIPDSEEAKYQTSVTSADTDDDGLIDSQEIFSFKTDPLKADTDGDGFNDGYEIRRNLNPLAK